jgi:hypothetical protein
VTYRTKFFDPDYRRYPKTNRYCGVCQRDLKPGQPHRRILYELDTMNAVHGEDWEIATAEITARRTARDPVSIELVGMDCARRLGLEWTRDPETR